MDLMALGILVTKIKLHLMLSAYIMFLKFRQHCLEFILSAQKICQKVKGFNSVEWFQLYAIDFHYSLQRNLLNVKNLSIQKIFQAFCWISSSVTLKNLWINAGWKVFQFDLAKFQRALRIVCIMKSKAKSSRVETSYNHEYKN